ncbi:MAG: biopolymer transporter ExbD [Mucinivorans sp.]
MKQHIKKKGQKGVPAISTSSLPDIIFMLLFFFMVTTTMREVEMKVALKLPEATEVQKLEKKSLASYIYIGPPAKQFQSKLGTAPRLQLNDNYATVSQVGEFIAAERDKLKEADRPDMTTVLKVNNTTKMGMVTELKQALRRASALRISYSAQKVEAPTEK